MTWRPRLALAFDDIGFQAAPLVAEDLAPSISSSSTASSSCTTDRTPDGARPLVFFDDLSVLSRPEPGYLVDARIVERSHGMIAGPSGAGKTFIMIAAGVAIASGTPWLGATIGSPGPVVYVLTEAAKVKGRIIAAKRAAGLPLDQAIGLYVLPQPVNLSDRDQVARLIDHLVPLRPRLVVIDTLSRCMSGDENSKTDTAVVVRNSDRIRLRTGASIWWVHHTGHADSRERGSTNLRASSDTVLLLSKTDDLLTLSCEKQRDADPFEPLRLRLVPVPGSDSCAVRLASTVTFASPGDTAPLSPAQHKVLGALRDHGQALTATQLADAIPSLDRSSIYRALRALGERGLVAQLGTKYGAVGGVAWCPATNTPLSR